ncbi:MAG: ATP-grasp domain-containing protein [Pseudomonadota bacterium]|nr:ATP-grasp domain-containing protein [Pseudomonadota bacterium]
MNVLLTAVGRRSYLVRYFQQALGGTGVTVVTNTALDAPAMSIADHAVVVPPSFHAEYPEAIGALCRQFDIRLLCSCHDLDVFALAPHREHLRESGVIAMLPDAEWARLCLDKFECGERIKAAGFAVPWASASLEATRAALARGEVRFPLVVKARLGFGSLALHRCHNLEQLGWFHQSSLAELEDAVGNRFLPLPLDERVLIQQCVQGPEHRVIVVNDLEGEYAAHFVAEVNAMRAGESDRATTMARDALGDLPGRFSRLTRHLGVWGLDVLLDADQPMIIDVNPRFTGDYPFQHLAGANVPAALIAWAQGVQPERAWLEPAVGVTGYKDLVPTRWPPPPVDAGADA